MLARSFSLLISASLAQAAYGSDCPQNAADFASPDSLQAQLALLQRLPNAALCGEQNEFLRAQLKNRVSPSRVIDAAVASRAPVVVIGESHSERSEKFYLWALERMKKDNPQLDCVAVEVPTDGYQKFLDPCNAKKDCANADLPEFSGVRQGIQLGLKVFAVDAQPDPRTVAFLPFGAKAKEEDKTPFSFVADVKKRNFHMATHTAQLFESHTCHGIVLVMGLAHGSRYPNLPSVPDLLRTKGIESYRIGIGSPGRDSFGNFDGRWRWTAENGAPLCPKHPDSLNENFGFLDQRAGENVPLFYDPFSDPDHVHKEFMGRWSDYNASIFLGCEGPLASRCTKGAANAPNP